MAPKKASTRAAARKIKDRWRAKNWYRVLAPDMFEGVQIGETLADDPSKLMDRVLDVTLQQLTGDFSKMHIKLLFKIDSVSGSDAFSNFVGHSLTSDYIRRLTRRKRSKMDGIFDITTKDGFVIRVKPFAVTEKRIQTSQQHAIRTKMKNVVEVHAKDKLVSEFIREMLSGEISSKIFRECKPIYPIKRVEIRRSEIITVPEGAKMTAPKPKRVRKPVKKDEAEPEKTEAEGEPDAKPPAAVPVPKLKVEDDKGEGEPEAEKETPEKAAKGRKATTRKATGKKETEVEVEETVEEKK